LILQEAQLMLTNPRDALVKVIKRGTIRYVSMLLVCYSNFVPMTRRY